MPLKMKKDKDCMKTCMHELKHKGTKERSHDQMVAICLKHCRQSKQEDMDTYVKSKYRKEGYKVDNMKDFMNKVKFNYEKDFNINIDTQKRTKFYCRLCGRDHFSDSMIGQHHRALLNKGYKKESPKKRYKQYLIEKKGEERRIKEGVGGRYY